jgi:hypothetical protein
MANVNSLLSQRFKKATDALSKMTALVEKSSFSGIFKVSPLSSEESERIGALLSTYSTDKCAVESDLAQLSALTAEVKAINTQAILLHGERIKRAQSVLKPYREGAFSAWLLATYGNRQTPYNFLQYYELYSSLPSELHPKLDEMPRQVAYSLASREGNIETKQELIRSYMGQGRAELLALIRTQFPLAEGDERKTNGAECLVKELIRWRERLRSTPLKASKAQKKETLSLLKELMALVEGS